MSDPHFKSLTQLEEEADQLKKEAEVDLEMWMKAYEDSPSQLEKDLKYFKKCICDALRVPINLIGDFYRERSGRNKHTL